MTQTDNLTTPSRGLPELGRYILKLKSATTAEERAGIFFTATNPTRFFVLQVVTVMWCHARFLVRKFALACGVWGRGSWLTCGVLGRGGWLTCGVLGRGGWLRCGVLGRGDWLTCGVLGRGDWLTCGVLGRGGWLTCGVLGRGG